MNEIWMHLHSIAFKRRKESSAVNVTEVRKCNSNEKYSINLHLRSFSMVKPPKILQLMNMQ